MALSVCENCQTVEGGWREPTLKECEENGMDFSSDPASKDVEALVCEACDSLGSYKGMAEHDDLEDR